MITGTLSRYFGMRFLTSVVGSFIGVVALAGDDRLRRTDAPRRRLAQRHGLGARQDFHVPRAAAHRTHHAVLGAGRRDVVLPDAVAAARTRRGAVGRHFRLAIRRSGHDRGLHLRHRRHHRLQSRSPPFCTNDRSVSKPTCSGEPVGVAGKHQRVLGPPEKRRRRGHHQCQHQPRARRTARRRHHLHLRSATATSSSGSRRKSATLEQGYWQLQDARIYASGKAPDVEDSYRVRHQSDA